MSIFQLSLCDKGHPRDKQKWLPYRSDPIIQTMRLSVYKGHLETNKNGRHTEVTLSFRQ